MKRFLLIDNNIDKNGVGDEWTVFESDDLHEVIREYEYHLNRYGEKLEIRDVQEIVDVDEDGEPINYNFEVVDYKNDIIYRAEAFNMHAICKRANVNYSTWRRFKSGLQNMSEAKKQALMQTMDEA